MHKKKVISKNVTEKCTSFTFTHVHQTCFAYNFFGAFFNNFFNGAKRAKNGSKNKKTYLVNVS
jgi:hypothetical protein